ncbi:MAG: hypothetical protein LBV27_09095 [Oscillospiraceae bacterium]|jgi:hypothetical protein|nr:hypothetical protein [Oscillospiraceae bacterium]
MYKDHRSFTKQDKVAIVALLFLIVAMMAISPYLPDERPGAIRKELTKQGYSVENVDFKYVADGEGSREWIFQSSAPIYCDGYYVNQWSVHSFTFSVGSLFVHYIIKPYPSLPEPVNVNVTFTADEFERVSKMSDSQPIEEYLKQIITATMEESTERK